MGFEINQREIKRPVRRLPADLSPKERGEYGAKVLTAFPFTAPITIFRAERGNPA